MERASEIKNLFSYNNTLLLTTCEHIYGAMDISAILGTPLTWETAVNDLLPVVQFVAGMVLYSVFVFKFYRFLAKRDIFEIDYSKYGKDLAGTASKFVLSILDVLNYVFLFPLFAIFWFLAIVVLLALLSKNQSVESILLISISLVTAVRVTAYYNEDLSKDLAKMLPFALLGIFLVDMTFFSLEISVNTLTRVPLHAGRIIYYCLFVVLLEIVLRVLYRVKRLILPGEEKEKEE